MQQAPDTGYEDELRHSLIEQAVRSDSVKVRAYRTEALPDALQIYVECRGQPLFACVLVTPEMSADYPEDGPCLEYWIYSGGFADLEGSIASALGHWAKTNFDASPAFEVVVK